MSQRRYTGAISAETALTGMQCCLRNATSLHEEAELLAEAGRWPRCIALLLIAWEELGKIPMLSSSPRYGIDENDWRNRFWRRFRSHKDKLFLHERVFPADQAKRARGPTAMLPVTDVRERMLYPEFDGESFESPTDIPELEHVATDLFIHVGEAIRFHKPIVESLDAARMTFIANATPMFNQKAREALQAAGVTREVPDIEIFEALLEAGLDARGLWEQLKGELGA